MRHFLSAGGEIFLGMPSGKFKCIGLDVRGGKCLLATVLCLGALKIFLLALKLNKEKQFYNMNL